MAKLNSFMSFGRLSLGKEGVDRIIAKINTMKSGGVYFRHMKFRVRGDTVVYKHMVNGEWLEGVIDADGNVVDIDMNTKVGSSVAERIMAFNCKLRWGWCK